ncbi:MAG: type IV toxin-antitoxin system AbiEi family antitoxin domain-containing protein [Saprospiraceae bacterium]|nr:type IV toxin-antitoxin system AbiEi family antitoxin domain-containing protein [Saprospiraceae bacterium]
MSDTTTIKQIFTKGAGYARTADVLAAGIHFSQLKKLEEAGVITKIKRGHYRWEGMAYWGGELPEIARLAPSGVFCLFTAAEYHNLTTYQPWQHHLAVERSMKVTGLPAGRVKMHYWSGPLLEFGIEIIQTEGGPIRLTDAARTVCDLVKYRNKTGMDTMLEAIRAYLRRKDKNLTLLLEYARRLRVEKVIRPYLEMAI